MCIRVPNTPAHGETAKVNNLLTFITNLFTPLTHLSTLCSQPYYYIAFIVLIIVLIIVPYRRPLSSSLIVSIKSTAGPSQSRYPRWAGGAVKVAGGGMAPPRTSTEEVIVDLCAKLVGAPQVGIIKYFSLYSVNIQCEVFAILTKLT